MMKTDKRPVLRKRRFRRRRRTHLVIVAVLAFVLAAIAGSVLYISTQPVTLSVAVHANSQDAHYLDVISKSLREQGASARLKVDAVESAEAAQAAFVAGRVDLVVARGDQMPAQDRAILVLRRDPIVIWTTSRIAKLADVGRTPTKIGMLGGDQGSVDLMRQLLSVEGAAVEKIEMIPLAALTVPGDTSIETFVVVHGANSRELSEALAQAKRSRGHVAILEITSADAVVRRNPALEAATIPKGMYGIGLPADEISTIDVSRYIVAHKALSDVAAATFAREVFLLRSDVLQKLSNNSVIFAPSAEKDAAVQSHPGVAAFIDGTERTFIERYSDYFWGVILILSGLGSLGATFRAYYYGDEHEELAASRREILDLAQAIRDGASAAQIHEFDGRVDRLVHETLARYDDGIIDEGGLAAFGLALDHYQGSRSPAK